MAVDITTHEHWDWEPHVGERGPEYLNAVFGPDVRAGFQTAHRLLGSGVQFAPLSVYDLDPAAVGTFDVVVCGSLLLHLREPLRALAAIRSVCDGQLLCTNQIDLGRSIGPRRAPLVRIDGTSGVTQWWIPNAAGHVQMIRAAGFTIERRSPLYSIPFGPAHPPRRGRLGQCCGAWPSGCSPATPAFPTWRCWPVPERALTAGWPALTARASRSGRCRRSAPHSRPRRRARRPRPPRPRGRDGRDGGAGGAGRTRPACAWTARA